MSLTEGMVLHVSGGLLPQGLLVRRLEARGGQARLRVRFEPRAGLLGGAVRSERRSGALVCTRGSLAVALQAAPDLPVVPGSTAETPLEPGRPLTFALMVSDRQPIVFVDPDDALRMLEDTDRWWRQWSSRITYHGPLVGSVVRSLITLRLLTYSP